VFDSNESLNKDCPVREVENRVATATATTLDFGIFKVMVDRTVPAARRLGSVVTPRFDAVERLIPTALRKRLLQRSFSLFYPRRVS
jgi:hypothetical protein